MTDWDDLRVFLAVARTESLSAAGKVLKLDPATVGRRVGAGGPRGGADRGGTRHVRGHDRRDRGRQPPGAGARSPRGRRVTDAAPVEAAAARFTDAWATARVAFSPYTRLAPPILCRTPADEQREGLKGSFAMIRMGDQRIVIGLGQVVELALAEHAHAILAHEVGHYVHAPGSLREHVRLHDRIRRTLPADLACHAGLVANLYTDLLLNDRLQRSRTADIAVVYVALRRPEASELWAVYMRAYERLWSLPADTLTAVVDASIEADQRI